MKMLRVEYALWAIVMIGILFALFVLLKQLNEATEKIERQKTELSYCNNHIELLRKEMTSAKNLQAALANNCDFDCGQRECLTRCQTCYEALKNVTDRISIKANKR